MKHGSLISPDDEGSFGFGTSKSMFEATSAGHQSGETVTVPDAALLFNGEFKRAGDDLKIVGQDGKSFLVEDYFKKDKHPTLLSPEGAALTPDVVDALAGPLAPGQYAQAGAPQSANQAIGRVEKVEGNATVVRNGVTITLNTGDVIQKGDVAQTGAGGSLAIVFSDGTAFNLAANARMVLNDFVYSAGGSNNSALISLVQGSISFVAGQVAKTGDMRVETPVATMGIRGTAVLVEVSANNGQTKFSVMVEPNGEVGSFNLYDKSTGNLIATVNSSSIGWVVTPTGPLQVLAQQVQKTPAELARELFIMQQVFQTFNSGPFDPNAPQQPTDPNKRGDTDTNTKTAGGPSGTPGSVTGDVIKVNIVSPTGANGQTGPGNPTNPNPNDPNAGDPTGPGDPGGPGAPDGPTQTQTLSINYIYGSSNDDNPLPPGTDGDDMFFGGAGDDVFIAAHGKGNDFFDGDGNGDNPELLAGPGFDTIRFDSANGVTFDLYGIVENNHAFSASTGYDTFINIEKVVGSPGNDIFILHGDTNGNTFNGEIDGGEGNQDTILLAGNLTLGENGPDIQGIEIIDLNTTNENVVRIEGIGAIEAIYGAEEGDCPNDTGNLVVNGSAGDKVYLTNDDNAGTWSAASCESPLNKDGYNLYIFHPYGGGDDALIYVKDGITADIAPEIELSPQTYLAFDGNDFAASAPASTQIDNVTIEGWIRWDGTPGNGHGQVLFYNGNTSTAGYGVFGDVVGNQLKLSGLAGGQNVMASDAYLSANEWHHVALVRDDGEFHLYVDGVEYDLDFADSGVAAINGGNHTFIGGNPDNPNEGFHGDIADVRLWDIVRTEQEIADAQSGSFTGNEPGLAGYWPLNEGTGTSAPDHTENCGGLTFNGQPIWTTALQTDEDQSVTINDIRVIDADAGDEQMHVTLSVAHGALELVDDCGVCVQTAEDGTVTISGTLANLNAALAAGVMFIPDANYNGADALHISVTDADGGTSARNIALALTPVNDAPVVFGDVNDEQTTVGTEFSFSFDANLFRDVDTGDSLTYSAKVNDDGSYENLPSWLHFDPATRTFSGTPPEGAASEYEIRVTATDTHGASASETFTLNVETPEVPAPVLDLDADDSSGATGSGYQTTATFGTGVAVLDSDATITDVENLTSATVKFTGESENGFTDYPNISLSIDVNELSGATWDPDSFSWSWHSISWQTMSGSSNLQILITGDGSAEDYLQLLGAARLQVGSNTFNTGGNVDITVDGDGGSTTATTTIDIPNRAPDINAYPFNSANETIDETDQPPSISKTLTIKDADADALSVTVTGVTAEGTLGAHQATDFDGFLWVDTPSGNQYTWHFAPNNETFDYLAAGESLILHYTVHADDGSATDDQTVNITINGTNDAPVVDVDHAIADASATTGTPFSFTLDSKTFFDVDSTNLTYTATLGDDSPLPNWLHFNEATGEFYGTPESNDAFDVKVTASDGEYSTSDTFTLTVSNPEIPNEAPVIHTDEAYTAGDDFSTILAGLSITDCDAGDDPNFGISFQAEHGSLRFADEEAFPSDYISSNGTLDDINYKIGNFGGVVYVAPVDADPEVNLTDTVTMTADDGHGGGDTVNFIFNATGPGGVSLTGTDQKDVLFATGGDDTLAGGDNADTFVFDHNVGQCGIGHDTVNDFMVGIDKIDLGAGFNSVPTTGPVVDFNCWVNTPGAFTECDGNTTIHLSDNEDIVLKNVQIAQLTANDFIIHPGGA